MIGDCRDIWRGGYYRDILRLGFAIRLRMEGEINIDFENLRISLRD